MQPLESTTIAFCSICSLIPPLFHLKGIATSTPNVLFKISKATYTDSCNSEVSVADFLDSIKHLTISMNDFMHCDISHLQCFSKGKVSSHQPFLFLFLTCFSSSTVSDGPETVVVSRDSIKSVQLSWSTSSPIGPLFGIVSSLLGAYTFSPVAVLSIIEHIQFLLEVERLSPNSRRFKLACMSSKEID